ncbi:MAG TPA: SH3 domain-containing protein [Polyangiaceae bacterium]
MGVQVRVLALALAVAVAATALLARPRAARAADQPAPQAFARVIVDSADLRTGPGVSYRVLYTAHRGETFALDGRPGTGFWLTVLLPDGRTAYALGDEVQPFAVNPNDEGAPSRPGLFAPPPLEGSRAGLALVGGVLSIPVVGGTVQRYGYVEARPSIVLHKTVSLEGFIGDGLTSDGTQLLYGAGVGIYLAPSWPVCPFVGLWGGGLSIFPNTSGFVTLQRQDLYVARAGGGVLLALRNRILVRIEATNLSLFNAEGYKNAQTYAGGLGVYF